MKITVPKVSEKVNATENVKDASQKTSDMFKLESKLEFFCFLLTGYLTT